MDVGTWLAVVAGALLGWAWGSLTAWLYGLRPPRDRPSSGGRPSHHAG